MFKRGSVDARTAQDLARLAGCAFTLERCVILAPQLMSILESAEIFGRGRNLISSRRQISVLFGV
jgi:hypothetical protein